MKRSEAEALNRLSSHDHGVLSTIHPDRGVDAIPVVYAVVDGVVGVPIDRVKPKSSVKLQRESNLDADPRATLLIEQWDRDDWSKLWWVRAELRYERKSTPDQASDLSAALSQSFDQYRDQPFAAILTFRVKSVSGWSARE